MTNKDLSSWLHPVTLTETRRPVGWSGRPHPIYPEPPTRPSPGLALDFYVWSSTCLPAWPFCRTHHGHRSTQLPTDIESMENNQMCLEFPDFRIIIEHYRTSKEKESKEEAKAGTEREIKRLTTYSDGLNFNLHHACTRPLGGPPWREAGLPPPPTHPARSFPDSQGPGAAPPGFCDLGCALTNIDIYCKENGKKSGVHLISVFIFPFSSIN